MTWDCGCERFGWSLNICLKFLCTLVSLFFLCHITGSELLQGEERQFVGS